MTSILETIDVAESVTDAFRCLSDPPAYLSPALRARWLSGNGPAVGSTWEEHFSIFGIPYASRFEVIDFDPVQRRMVGSIAACILARQERTVVAAQGGSRLSIRVNYDPPAGFLGRIARIVMSLSPSAGRVCGKSWRGFERSWRDALSSNRESGFCSRVL